MVWLLDFQIGIGMDGDDENELDDDNVSDGDLEAELNALMSGSELRSASRQPRRPSPAQTSKQNTPAPVPVAPPRRVGWSLCLML